MSGGRRTDEPPSTFRHRGVTYRGVACLFYKHLNDLVMVREGQWSEMSWEHHTPLYAPEVPGEH